MFLILLIPLKTIVRTIILFLYKRHIVFILKQFRALKY